MALDTTRLKAIIGITCVLGAFAVSFGSGDAKQSEESNLGPKAAGKKSAAGSEKDPVAEKPKNHGKTDEPTEAPTKVTVKEDEPVGHGKKAAAVGKKKPAARKFVISSHTNFNVIPHGVIKFGGKGKPGDKVMVFVDGKPSMKGTIKKDGRWTFNVKIAQAGFRTLAAQNLITKEKYAVKLKIH